jgi:hypothetical protein
LIGERIDRAMFEEVRAVADRPERGLSRAVRKLLKLGLREHHRRVGIEPARESWDR